MPRRVVIGRAAVNYGNRANPDICPLSEAGFISCAPCAGHAYGVQSSWAPAGCWLIHHTPPEWTRRPSTFASTGEVVTLAAQTAEPPHAGRLAVGSIRWPPGATPQYPWRKRQVAHHVNTRGGGAERVVRACPGASTISQPSWRRRRPSLPPRAARRGAAQQALSPHNCSRARPRMPAAPP